MARIPIALQLYSVRDDCARDFPGTLKAVAKMGYEGVEFAGYYDHSATELRKMLDDLGLKCSGTHIGLDTLLGDSLQSTIDFNKTIGNKFLIVPGLPPERTNSKVAWQGTARIFNEISAKVRPQGLYVGYHNHTTEFAPLEGEMPWDTFFGGTSNDVVMQFDVGNALCGGAAAAPFLRKYPHRALTVHVKEYAPGNDKALIGEGNVDWNEIFGICETIGNTEWYVVEQESYAHAPLECVEKCLQNLKRMGK